MKTAVITKFDPAKARVKDEGRRLAFTLMPEEWVSNTVLHWIKCDKEFSNQGELNDIQKTIVIFDGAGVFVVDGIDMPVQRGDVLWLPKGSYHSVRTESSELQYIVVKDE